MSGCAGRRSRKSRPEPQIKCTTAQPSIAETHWSLPQWPVQPRLRHLAQRYRTNETQTTCSRSQKRATSGDTVAPLLTYMYNNMDSVSDVRHTD